MQLGTGVTSVQCSFNSLEESNHLSQVIECGIKFFLFQRCQISAPYETLSAKKVISVKLPPIDVKEAANSQDEGFGLSGCDRMIALRERRRDDQRRKKLARKMEKLSAVESSIREVWDDVFSNLRSLFDFVPVNMVHSVVLSFGASVYNPKETVTFEIVHEDKDTSSAQGTFQTQLRSFLKNIIMSTQYLDFTDKPLRSTGSHICLWTHQELDSKSDTTPIAILRRLDNVSGVSSPIRSFTSQKSNRKEFKVVLSCTSLNKSCMHTCPKEGAAMVDPNLNCYQIPFKFQGVRVPKSNQP